MIFDNIYGITFTYQLDQDSQGAFIRFPDMPAIAGARCLGLEYITQGKYIDNDQGVDNASQDENCYIYLVDNDDQVILDNLPILSISRSSRPDIVSNNQPNVQYLFFNRRPLINWASSYLYLQITSEIYTSYNFNFYY